MYKFSVLSHGLCFYFAQIFNFFCKCENKREIKLNILRVLCQVQDRPQQRTSDCRVPTLAEVDRCELERHGNRNYTN